MPFIPQLTSRFITCVCAKLLQSCPSLCEPMDCGPSGSSVHGDSAGKNIEVYCHALLQGIFLTPGLNIHLLCLVGSLPLAPSGKPRFIIFPNYQWDILCVCVCVRACACTHIYICIYTDDINAYTHNFQNHFGVFPKEHIGKSR